MDELVEFARIRRQMCMTIVYEFQYLVGYMSMLGIR
jgi:hypothetical protein